MFTQEQNIIAAAMQQREHFDRIRSHKPQEFLSDMGKIIWKFIEEYYEADSSAKNVDSSIILSRIAKAHPKHIAAFEAALAKYSAQNSTMSGANVALEVRAARKQRLAEEIRAEILRDNDQVLGQLFSEYLSVGEEAEDSRLYRGASLPKDGRISGKRIPIAPKALNDLLKGGALPQHHILIFAFTEVGKTFMALNMARAMVQHGFKVLYLQNEEPGEDLHFRFMRSLTELTEEQIHADREKAEQIAAERGGDLFNLVEMCPGTPAEIEAWIRKIDPDVFFVDQVKNLAMAGDGRPFDEAIKSIRRIGKKYNKLAISLAQAGDRACGKRMLAVNDVHDSRVEVPGACDLMLGLGATEDMLETGRRTIVQCKNKVSGVKMPIDCVFNARNMRVQ